MAKTVDPIKTLLKHGFLLGGSRRMAEKYPKQIKIRDYTDYDFYGANTPENGAKLEALGYENLEGYNEVWDNQLAALYVHENHDIQVLLRHDVDLYKRAFESITAEDFIAHVWKSSPLNYKTARQNKKAFAEKVRDFMNKLFEEHSNE